MAGRHRAAECFRHEAAPGRRPRRRRRDRPPRVHACDCLRGVALARGPAPLATNCRRCARRLERASRWRHSPGATACRPVPGGAGLVPPSDDCPSREQLKPICGTRASRVIGVAAADLRMKLTDRRRRVGTAGIIGRDSRARQGQQRCLRAAHPRTGCPRTALAKSVMSRAGRHRGSLTLVSIASPLSSPVKAASSSRRRMPHCFSTDPSKTRSSSCHSTCRPGYFAEYCCSIAMGFS
jgi:hypothetical protein